MKYLFVLIICLTGIYVTGQVRLGAGTSLIYEEKAFGMQIRGAYQSSDHVSFSGAFSYYFKKESNFGIDLDAQFHLVSIDKVKISPLAGANIRRSNSKLGTGLQLGFFIEISADNIGLYIEPKAILDENTVIVLSGGLYF
ncbi:MAG: hypothetical protein IPN29_11985 [Saprospiraceae bacterium]|nr:hypothetical protein [Saprospiraceae bacterium]